LENKRVEQVLPGSREVEGGQEEGKMAQKIYTNVSNCKNNKKKEKEQKYM
jgi:hypothetical protein